MPIWNDILIRDSLQDVGITPSPGYPYYSPDIICTQQTTYPNPTQQFSGASYTTDPNQPLINQQNNNFYVRGKNMGTASQTGNMYVYWTKASLVMTPDIWFNQAMTSLVQGKPQNYVTLPSVAGGQISVGQTPFNWTPVPIGNNDHFCVLGAVGTNLHPWPPAQAPSFANYDAFISWVRNSQNICWRNLTLISNPNVPEWDRVDGFFNKWNADMPMLVSAKCTNVPVNTSISLICTALGINVTQAISSPNQTVYSSGVTCPAQFSGQIETVAQLPTGTTWPAGAQITTTVFIATLPTSAIARFAHDFRADAKHPHVMTARRLSGSENGQLVALGNCSTAYQPQG